uniref:Translocated intimin receptor Tir n=1 Tax=Escherichia coli O127:H6 (strain E2348/69 / EPEC) TaxID=574521 RepID=UPI000DCF63D6|nr:Chain B, Translocated intimin receptor Tir [Escherichia coli O127:H6 str. E2348/69]
MGSSHHHHHHSQDPGGTGHLISSTGALGSRSLFSPLRNSMADSVDSRDIPGLPTNPSRLAAAT